MRWRSVKVVASVLAIPAVTLSIANAQPSDRTLDYLATFIQGAGYTPELPPTTLPVNSLYRRQTDTSGIKFYTTRCPSVFTGAPIAGSSNLGSFSFSSGFKAGLSAKFLPELVAKSGVSFDAKMSAEKVKSITIKFGITKTAERPIGALTAECDERLKKTSVGGKLAGENRIVLRTLTADVLEYKFELDGNFEAVANLIAAKFVEANANFKVTPNKEERKIEIKAADGIPFTVGINAIAVGTIADVLNQQ